MFLHKLLSTCKHVRRGASVAWHRCAVRRRAQRSATDVQLPHVSGLADALASIFSFWLRAPRPGCSLLGLDYAARPSFAVAGLARADLLGRVAFGAPIASDARRRSG